MKNSPERYNRIYGSVEGRDHFYGEGKPVPIVEKIPSFVLGGKALDIGAGDGVIVFF